MPLEMDCTTRTKGTQAATSGAAIWPAQDTESTVASTAGRKLGPRTHHPYHPLHGFFETALKMGEP